MHSHGEFHTTMLFEPVKQEYVCLKSSSTNMARIPYCGWTSLFKGSNCSPVDCLVTNLQDKADLAPQALGERHAIKCHRTLLPHVTARSKHPIMLHLRLSAFKTSRTHRTSRQKLHHTIKSVLIHASPQDRVLSKRTSERARPRC